MESEGLRCVTVTSPRDLPELKKRDERQIFVQRLLETG